MNTNKKINQTLTRNQIISSIVWATVIIAVSLNSDGSNKEIMYILLAGFFVEFLRISSSNKFIKKANTEEGEQ